MATFVSEWDRKRLVLTAEEMIGAESNQTWAPRAPQKASMRKYRKNEEKPRALRGKLSLRDATW